MASPQIVNCEDSSLFTVSETHTSVTPVLNSVRPQETSTSHCIDLESASPKGHRFSRRVRNFGHHASHIATALDPTFRDLVDDASSISVTSSNESGSDSDSDKSDKDKHGQDSHKRRDATKSGESRPGKGHGSIKAPSPLRINSQQTTNESNEGQASKPGMPMTPGVTHKVPKKIKKNTRVRGDNGTAIMVSETTSINSTRSSKNLEDDNTASSVDAQVHDTDFQGIPRKKTFNPKSEVVVVEKEISSSGGSHSSSTVKHRSSGLRIGETLTWIFMIMMSLLFIALGVLAAVSNGHDLTSEMGYAVSEALKVSVSLWPIAFAAIVAQSLRAFASFKAERGLKLITLEQLMSSHSLAGAIKQPFFLRRVDVTSIALLALWALSPLTGQALLRASYLGDSSISTSFTYLNTSMAHNGLGGAGSVAILNAVFLSSLLSPQINEPSPMDFWNNFKVPILPLPDSTELQYFSLSHKELMVQSEPGKPANFSSLVGVPVYGVWAGDSTFNITSSYWSLSCSKFQATNASNLNSSQTPFESSASGTLHMGISPNPDQKSGRLAYASMNYSDLSNSTLVTTSCTFNPILVDLQILCQDTDCAVTAMRPSLSPMSSFAPISPAILTNFLTSFINAGASSDPGTPTPIEEYIGTGSIGNGAPVDITNPTSLINFQTSLALLFNTYWQLSLSPTGFADPTQLPPSSPNATGSIVFGDSLYNVSWPWLGVLLFSSLVLLAASVAGAVWSSRTVVAGDVLGFASGGLLDSKYIEVPQELKGRGVRGVAGKLRAMGDTKVMLQDVRAGREVGKVVLGTVGGGRERVRAGRKYK